MSMRVFSNCPCKYCNQRDAECHSKCDGYKGWKLEVDRLKDVAYTNYTRECDIQQLSINRGIEGIRKRQNGAFGRRGW